MLFNISNTLRVLVDGVESKDDFELFPSELFENTFNFDDAVGELLDQGNIDEIISFIRLCICVDTIAPLHEYIVDDGNSEQERILAEGFADLFQTLLHVFFIDPSVYGAHIMDGTASRDPRFSGLTGRFLQLYIDFVGDTDNRMFRFLTINKTISAHNPSTTEAWWLDTIRNVYSDNDADLDDAPSWYNDDDDVLSRNEIIEVWYLRMNPQLHRYYSLSSEVYQNESPNSIIGGIITSFNNELIDLSETLSGIPKISEFSDVVETSIPVTIEQANFMIMLMLQDM